MRLKNFPIFWMGGIISAVFVFHTSAQTTISSNRTGKQGNYYYEYWKDNGSGTMTLGDGCNFSCQWGQVGNILFRNGVRPGSRNIIISYTADYKPQGNSYLSIYGWFENPLVEYYIIESWGSWKPPGGRSKGTFESDSGTYDIYQNSRTGPSIKGSGTFQQYWSVRKTKRTSGVITCANHFDAWEKAGMTIGKFYEVSFNVEAYQSSGGSADVKVTMDTIPRVGISGGVSAAAKGIFYGPGHGNSGTGRFNIVNSDTRTVSLRLTAKLNGAIKVFNLTGQQVATVHLRKLSAGDNSITMEVPNLPGGVYHYFLRNQE